MVVFYHIKKKVVWIIERTSTGKKQRNSNGDLARKVRAEKMKKAKKFYLLIFFGVSIILLPLPALMWVPPISCGAKFTGPQVGG